MSYPDEIYQPSSIIPRLGKENGNVMWILVAGSGKSTHCLARLSDKAVGIDHSEAMATKANAARSRSKLEPIHFLVANAEGFDKPAKVSRRGIDLIISGWQ